MSYLRRISIRFWKHIHVFSLGYALVELLVVLDRKISDTFGTQNSATLLRKKEEYIIPWAKGFFAEDIAAFQDADPSDQSSYEDSKNSTIWLCWLQGEESAPPLVKELISNTRRRASGHEVVLLTESNIQDYCDIPEFIIQKHRQGLMPVQQFADILRTSLIHQKGGLWIDATMLLLRDIPDEVFSLPIYNVKGLNPNFTGFRRVPDADLYQCYFIAGHKDSVTYSFINQCLLKYWSRYDTLIDYFLISYLFKIARESIPPCSYEFELLPNNNQNCELLNELLSKQSQDGNQDCKNLLSSETWLYKLTWKKGYPLYDSNGEATPTNTVFQHLLQ
ncbi:capsular polysaccharide synthesis protein [Bifidobacterium sp.]|uniref:capsular polysaccharide synthesis protein n=1 Tax=Bifidobacterium sp. TaxID=41200 RepID=UPI0039EA7CB8